MKSFVISMLFAAAVAQQGYTCDNPDGDGAWAPEDFSGDVSTAEECKEFTDAFVSAVDPELIAGMDICLSATVVADPAGISCILYGTETVEGADIRAEATPEDGTTHWAWAWAAGEPMEDLTLPEEEEEEDEEEGEDMSVRMTLSALATASIAMLAMWDLQI